MKAFFITSLSFVFLSVVSSYGADVVTGKVTKVRDADTIVVSGVAVRLNGVDAPENGTQAGNEATAAMKRFVRGKTVTCELNGQRTHDRWVGVCVTDEGNDIGAVMIANGLALDCQRYSGSRYRSLEPVGARSRLRQSRYC